MYVFLTIERTMRYDRKVSETSRIIYFAVSVIGPQDRPITYDCRPYIPTRASTDPDVRFGDSAIWIKQ